MARLYSFLIVISALLGLSLSQATSTINFGAITTVDLAPSSTPTINGNAIDVEPTTDNSTNTQIEVFLSPGLQSQLQGIADNCPNLSQNDCASQLAEVLRNSPVQSSTLERRQLSQGAQGIALTGAILAALYGAGQQPQIMDHMVFDTSEIPDIKDTPGIDPTLLVYPAMTVTLSGEGSATTQTSTAAILNYVIVPTMNPTVGDKVRDIVHRQAERYDFEVRAGQQEIILSRVLMDAYVDLWTADLDDEQVAWVKTQDIIMDVFENFQIVQQESGTLGKRSDYDDDDLNDILNSFDIERRQMSGWTRQANAPAELSVISDPTIYPVINPQAQSGDYDYIQSAGNSATVYVIEQSPFNTHGPEFTDVAPDDIDGFMIPNPAIRNTADVFTTDLSANQYHATAVLSKVIGKTAGVAKFAKVVCVRLQRIDTANGILQYQVVMNTWRTIFQDIVDKLTMDNHGNIIINFSQETIGMTSSDSITPALNALKTTWSQLSTIVGITGKIAIVLAGVTNPNSLQTTNGQIPIEMTAASLNPDLNIVVAGWADLNFNQHYSTDPFSNVWGIGEQTTVANYAAVDRSAADGTITASGASFVAPQVAGLLATAMENPLLNTFWNRPGKTSQYLSLRFLQKVSSKRYRANLFPLIRLGGASIIYNLAESTRCPSGLRKRDDGQCVDPDTTTTATTTSATDTVSVQSNPNTSPATPTPTFPVITSGNNKGTCGDGKIVSTTGFDGNFIDKNTVQGCLANLDTSKWLDATTGSTFNCHEMVIFQSASKSWNSPADCYDACKNCLSQSIADGVSQIWCNAWSGSAHCWIGYTDSV